jgi:hypothetical protein
MWQHRDNDLSYHFIPSDVLDLCIATRTKKGISAGRVCTWNICMVLRNVNYGYVQIKSDFVGRLDDAKQYAENYLKNLKENIPV